MATKREILENDPESGLPLHELEPQAGAPRVIGPGRRERAYQDRIRALEAGLGEATATTAAHRSELEVARLVERGSQRLIDRVEAERDRERGASEQARQEALRLATALGAIASENKALAESNARLAGELREVRLLGRARPPKKGIWSGLFGRRA